MFADPIDYVFKPLQVTMNKKSKKNPASPETQQEALKIARRTQRPGQTKEQTKLIAQGIQKGIQQYKMQHKAKLRELSKKQKHSSRSAAQTQLQDSPQQSAIIYRQHWLPWLLLAFTWLGIVVYWFFF